jgi:hypothetical protein
MKLDIIGDVHKGKRRFEERTIEGCIVRDHDGHPLEQRSDRGVAIQAAADASPNYSILHV